MGSEAISNNFISATETTAETVWPWALKSLSRCLTHGLRLSQAAVESYGHWMKLKLAIACWNFSRKVLLLRWQTKAQGLHKVCEPPLLRDFVSAQGELRGSHQPFSWKLGPCNTLRGTARWAAGDCIVFWDSILLSGWENLVGSYGCTTLHDLRSTSWNQGFYSSRFLETLNIVLSACEVAYSWATRQL